MNDALLERRCRRLCRAYRDPSRAEEALTTLMESNAGRDAPRSGDVVNVLWHGVVSRLRNTAPGGRFAQWGDAAAGAFAQLAVIQAATAVALLRYLSERPLTEYPMYHGGWREPQYAPVFVSRYEQAVAIAFAVLAVGTALGVCLGRVRTARALSVLTVLAGFGGVLGSEWSVLPLTLRTSALVPVVVVSLVVMFGAIGTTAVARATRSVPAFWWGTSAMACLGVASAALWWGWAPFDLSRPGLVLVAYGLQPVLLLALAMPLARPFPGAFGAVAAVALAAMPLTVLVVDRWITATYDVPTVIAGSLGGGMVVALLGVLALRSRSAT